MDGSAVYLTMASLFLAQAMGIDLSWQQQLIMVGVMMLTSKGTAGLPVAEGHVATNLLGTIRMTYAFLPLLVGKDDAVVVNVTSALAFVPFPSTPTYSATKAALHSFSESLRIQLAGADAGVQVIEVVPPGVRTTLMGQQDSDQSMPLDDFLTETLALLREKPDAKELVVERAGFIRDAVANGSYDDVLTMISGS
ncbi:MULTISPECIES: SDR family NAD(P)-dependent oxidoreductase [unclassified Streptomyces]|uniref:SDR family NAD(P)-dependent oxidoreductase n=1 Tax=unclassified Streptomyces TaxID=2593676 RepID=UPI0036E50668